MTERKRLPECFKEYEDGKHRRYSLLFAVNGGAFAVAKLLENPKACSVLGALSLRQLAVGMMVFTAVMVADIFIFGRNMRSTLPEDAFHDGQTLPVFDKPGTTVLAAIALLILAGWLFAAAGRNPVCS